MRDLVLSCLESRVENNRSIYARFVLAPFHNGDALTVGTALRRALLAQVNGIAITALEIQGVTHEFCTIPGVRESVLELSLNFQQVVLRNQFLSGVHNSKIAQVGYLQVRGPAVVYANDLKLPLGIECVDPAQHLATLSRDGLLVLKFLIGKTAPSRDLRRENTTLAQTQMKEAKTMLETARSKEMSNSKTQSTTNLQGLADKAFQPIQCFKNIIPLDSFSSPVTRANFAIQVDDLSNKERERLIFEIWTNGSVHPRQAIQSAVLSLVILFSEFRRLIHLDSHSLGMKTVRPNQVETVLSKRLSFLYKSKLDKMSLLSSDLSNLSLSLKTYLQLKQKGVDKLETLLNYSGDTLLQLVNGNKNMFYDIKRCVCALGFELN